MKLRIGSKVYCHTCDYHLHDHQIFIVGNYYTIEDISPSGKTVCFKVNGQFYYFEIDDIEDHFSYLNELRREKIEKLKLYEK